MGYLDYTSSNPGTGYPVILQFRLYSGRQPAAIEIN